MWLNESRSTPIFISLGSGNKVTDSDIDRWPLLASQMCIIIPLVSAPFQQWQAAQGYSRYAGRKHCSARSSFIIHYNTLFIKQADQAYPFTPYTSCNALPLLWFLLGLRDARVVLYQEYLAIISLSPTGQFSDLHTACSLHFYPVYVDSCMHYEVVVGVRCVRYSNFAWGITAGSHLPSGGKGKRKMRHGRFFFVRQDKFFSISEQKAAHKGRDEFSF